jgi:hypothetical protein
VPITITDDSATIGTAEYSLPAATTSGVPTSQTTTGYLQAWIDFAAMAAGDQYRIRLYEKVNGVGATQRLVEEWILTGAQSKPAWTMPPVLVGRGWDVTVTRLAGTDRTIGWSLRVVT